VVPIPVAAAAQWQELDVSMLIDVSQREIRALSQRMDMVDGIGQRRQSRDFALAVITPAARPTVAILEEDCFALVLPPPGNVECMDVIFRDVKDINRRFPTTKHFNALNVNLVKDGQNIIERLAPISTIHCIVQQAFEGDVVDSMLKLKEERGDTIMWYVCGSEPANMIDGLPCIPGTQKRILFWSQYLHNLDGFLYWQTCYWEGQDNIWADDYESQRIRPVGANEPATGEGVYFYWHPETKMPVYTIGLDAMRDGIEDFQLLRMAEEVLGKEAVMNFVKEVVSSRIDFTKDDGVLMAVRNELAAALVAATAA
jgi:urease gamma subunit